MLDKLKSTRPSRSQASNYGWAWIVLCLTLALHVTDEALTDFLAVYNSTVERIHQKAAFLPLPTFTFSVWLTGLVIAIILLLALSVFAYKNMRWMIPVSYGFGILMIGNALLHIASSFYLGRFMPGVYSSPLLLLFSLYLLRMVRNSKK
jgi:hypothetical protein